MANPWRWMIVFAPGRGGIVLARYRSGSPSRIVQVSVRVAGTRDMAGSACRGVELRAFAVPLRDPIEEQDVVLVAVHAVGPDVLLTDLRPALDHVDQGHRMPPPEVVVRLEPVHDLAGLGGRAVAALVGLVDQLARRLAGLLLDGVE